ncbi:MAG TPA: DNA polymerase III subunit delta [Clostridia bacterium]|nr:DNA polymerase III subunit delta [Clostridia bacterium]
MNRGTEAMGGPPPSLALFWGDDDLGAARAVDRLARAHAELGGVPLDRWDVRGESGSPAELVGQLAERLATPVMFGGGTLAVVTGVGPLLRRNDLRDALLGAIGTLAPGNVLVFVEAAPSGTKAAPQKRLADAIAAAGGVVRRFEAPKAGGLTAWIEAEARERGIRLGAGAGRELAARIGGFVSEGDAERRHQTRIASAELDKLALYRPDAYVEAADVRALVAEAVPDSMWAMTDAVGERRIAKATRLLDHLLETAPEPVLLNVLHRRIRELLEVADRLAAGEAPPAIGRAMKIGSEFRVRNLVAQARAWTVAELAAALDGLVELDAMVKGAPGTEPDPAQRRLAFLLWVADRVARPA